MWCPEGASSVEPGVGQLAAVADQLLAPVNVVAADSTVLYVNAAAAHSIGREPRWLIGRRLLELVHPDDRARVIKVFLTGADHRRITYRQLRKDGSYAWVEVNLSLIHI